MLTQVVGINLDDSIRLRYLKRSILVSLEKNGFVVKKSEYGPALVLNRPEKQILGNPYYLEAFVFLAKAGAAFCNDSKLIDCPSNLMRMSQEHGYYNNSFISCVYDGKEWIYETIHPAT